MDQLQFFQHYWWLLISILGAALVFLLFVQGGQSMLYNAEPESRSLMVNSLGRKWELTFTTLVVFGGAFFASFPLFYSTSFGGAYWLWMLILLSFVVQAFSYEFRRKRGNIYGTRTYDGLLMFNGFFGCILLGVAVGTMFFGAHFGIVKSSILNGASPVISRWAPSHGIEAILDWRCVLLGITIYYLARTLGAMYFLNNISAGEKFNREMRIKVYINGVVFAVVFVVFAVVLLSQSGLRYVDGKFVDEPNIYLHNLLLMPWAAVLFCLGVILVLYGIFRTITVSNFNRGIWFCGIGTVLVVFVLFVLAGFCDTAYLPSLTHPSSSLTIANSSASLFSLRTMSYVSLIIPFVLAYIIYVWRKMNATPLTPKEVESDSHSY